MVKEKENGARKFNEDKKYNHKYSTYNHIKIKTISKIKQIKSTQNAKAIF